MSAPAGAHGMLRHDAGRPGIFQSENGRTMTREKTTILHDQLQQVLLRLTQLATTCEARKKCSDDIAKELWGNGDVGLKVRVDRMEQALVARKEMRNSVRFVINAAIAVGSGIVAAVGAVLAK